MESFEFKIPNDPAVLLAMSRYLAGLAGPHTSIAELAASTAPTEPSVPLDPPTAPSFELPPQVVSVPEFPPFAINEPETPQVVNAPESAGELDSEGLPWDERIHTAQKTKMKTGAWKLKRGVDKALVTRVKAEYLSDKPDAAPAPNFPPVPVPPTPTTPPAPVATVAEIPSPPPVPTPPENLPPASPTLTFEDLMRKIGPRLASPQGAAFSKIVNEVVAQYGTVIGELAGAKSEFVPQIYQELEQQWTRLTNTQG